MAKYEVTFPLPGIFHRRAAPDAPLYVEEGSQVEAGAVIGVVEVMKQFSELQAGQAGVLTRFEVEDGSALEPGQVIALIDDKS